MDFAEFLRQQKDQANAAPSAPSLPTDATQAPAPAPAPSLAPQSQATGAPNDFASFLRQQQAQQKQATEEQARAVSIGAAQADPNVAAEAAKTGRDLNLPQTVVEADPERFKQQALIKKNTDLVASNPVLAQWIAANPESARIARDEYDKLGFFEKRWSNLGDLSMSFGQGLGASWNTAMTDIYAIGGLPAVAYDAAKAAITGTPNQFTAQNAYYRTFVDPLLRDRQALQLRQGASFGEKATYTAGSLLSLMSQAVLTGGESMPATALPAAAGAKEAVAAALEHGTKAMAFPALTQAIDTGRQVLDVTNDPARAAAAAMGTYAVTTAQGLIPLSAPGSLLTRLGTGFVAGGAGAEASRQAMNLLLPPEMRQQFDGEDLVLQALAGGIMGGVLGPRAEPRLTQAVRQTFGDALQAERANKVSQELKLVTEQLADSKLREANPDKFREFLQKVTDNSDVQDLLINGRALQQAVQETGVQLPDSLNAQLGEAIAAGHDVRVPVADYLTHIAGTELQPKIEPQMRAEADGPTFGEAESFYQNAVKEMTDRAAALTQQRAQDQAYNESRQKVYDDVVRQVTATNRFTPEVAKQYGVLWRDFFSVLGDRLGMAPEEAYQQHGARIVAGDQQGNALHQNYTKEEAEFFKSQGIESPSIPEHAIQSLADEHAWIERGEKNGLPVWKSKHVSLESPRDVTESHDVFYKPLGNERAVKYDLHDAEGKKVGYTVLELDGDWPKRLLDIQVNEEHRGKQIAENTVTSLLSDTGELGIWSIVPSARSFWERIGTRANGEHDGVVSLEDNAVARANRQNTGGLGKTLKQETRGFYSPEHNLIGLLKEADLSTFVHESGHFFFDTLTRIAAQPDAPAGLRADAEALIKFAGGDSLQEWLGRDIESQREGHEKVARAFESYLFEGRAPNLELQTLFAKVRQWMLSVYKSLTSLNVELTPEVRQVFDRMLASEDAIKYAEEARAYMPIAPSLDLALKLGMTEKQYRDYLELHQRGTDEAIAQMTARSLRDMKWASNAKARALKDLQKQAEAQRDRIREEVTQQVDNSPEMKAKRELAETQKQFDADPFAADIRNDLVAARNGFANVDAMTHAIEQFGDRDQRIQQLTDQRMLEEHGELVNPRAVNDAAIEAVHNEARARFLATGLKMLSSAKVSATALVKAAREAATATINRKRIGELSAAEYLAAETRANREAQKLAAKKPQEAIEAQRQAVLNNALAKAAQEAKATVDKGLAYLKSFDSATKAKAIGADYMDRINEMLSKYDVTNRHNTIEAQTQRLEFREWLQSEFGRTGVMPEVADNLLDFATRKHWKEMTVEEFGGLVDAIKSLEHVGREQTRITLDGKKVALDDVVQEAKSHMESLKHTEPVDVDPHLQHAKGLDKISAKFLHLKSWIRSADAALLKMEQQFQWLDGGARGSVTKQQGGPFARMFKRIADAEGLDRTMRAEVVAELRALGNRLRDAKVNLSESLQIPALRRAGRGAQWYREELIAAALNTGNRGNLDKLVKGYGWNETELLAALNQHMSKAEWDFVQGVWNTVGKYGPQIAELQRRLTGVTPEMVKPQKVVTRHGVYEGGYYPVVYDAFADRNIEQKTARNADMLFENNWAKPTTNQGHTVARTGYTGPIDLSLSVISRHIDQVTHDLAFREAIIDVNKFLSRPEIRDEVDQVMGREYTKQFRPWLQAMANDKVYDTSGASAWEKIIRKARMNTTMVGLGFRLSTMEIHGLSALSNSIGEIGAKWMAKGTAQFATPDRWKATRDFIFERSPEMATRMNEVDRNVTEAINQINEHAKEFGARSVAQKIFDNATKFAFHGVAMLDMASAMPTWMGAYLKAMAHERDGGLNMSEDAAIDYANRAVRNAHGGGGVKDLAAVQRSKGAMSLATMFYSFWNHMYNRQRDLARAYGQLATQGGSVKDFSAVLARSFWYFVVPQLIHALLKPSQDKDKDDSLAGHAKHIGEEVALGTVSGVPVMRDLANALVNGRDYAITPIETAGKALVQTIRDGYHWAIGEETSKKPLKNAAAATGYAFGLPTGQIGTSAQFIWDVINGEQSPQSLADWWDGIHTGKIDH